MSTFSAVQLANATNVAPTAAAPAVPSAAQPFGIPVPPSIYVMRGMDANIAGRYDVWQSTGTPDFAGASYPGSISKSPPLATPLRNIVIQVPPK